MQRSRSRGVGAVIDDEEQLITRARGGDTQAFGDLLRANDAKMRGVAYRLLGDQNAMDDVLQDAYLKAFRSIRRYEPDRSGARFSTWLYHIVHSCCMDHHRRVARRPVSARRALEEADRRATDPSATAAVRGELRQALLSLSPDHAAVVALVDGEGYSYDEVGETLGLQPGTVASRLSRARSQLRIELSGQEGGKR